MIRNFISTAICSAVLFLASCGGSKDPVAYNNAIISVINDSERQVTLMNEAMNAADYAKAEEVRLGWEKSVNEDIKKVEDLGDFNGDAAFQQAVLNGLKGYQKIVTEDYPKLINIRKTGTAADADKEAQLLDNINAAFEDMAKGVNEASDKFEQAYKK